MRSSAALLCALALAAPVLSCEPRTQAEAPHQTAKAPESPSPEAVRASVDSLNEVWRAAAEKKDAVGMASIFASDVLFIQDGDTIRGRGAVEQGFKQSLPYYVHNEFKPFAFYTSGDLAVMSATFNQDWKKDGKTIHEEGIWTNVLRRSNGGSWQSQVLSFSMRPPSK